MKDLYIALVEDDEDDVNLLSEIFQKYHSVPIRHFANGHSFLKTLNGSLPCLVVLDLHLPDIELTELINKIRSNVAWTGLPVMVYSTNYSPAQQQTCERYNLELFKKPNSMKEWEDMALVMAMHCDHRLLKHE